MSTTIGDDDGAPCAGFVFLDFLPPPTAPELARVLNVMGCETCATHSPVDPDAYLSGGLAILLAATQRHLTHRPRAHWPGIASAYHTARELVGLPQHHPLLVRRGSDVDT